MEQIVAYDEATFNDKYYFSNYQKITVLNPLIEDYKFQMMVDVGIDRATAKPRIEQRTFVVLAGSQERFVGSVANLYLDQMAKLIAQKENRFKEISDFTAKAGFYDTLIVYVDDPMAEASYMPYEDVNPAALKQAEAPVAAPFAGAQATNEESERLRKENEELRALLEAKTAPAVEVEEPKPAASAAAPFADATEAKRGPGRPPKQA